MPIKVNKQFKFNLDKLQSTYSINIYKKFKKEAEKKLKAWERTLKDRLNRKVSKNIIVGHKIRPDAPFPHLNSGKLRNSIKVTIKERIGEKYLSLLLSAKIGPNGTNTALLTNLGYPKRKSGSIPSWVGWVDRIINTPDGNEDVFLNRVSNSVPSFNDIVTSLLERRRPL